MGGVKTLSLCPEVFRAQREMPRNRQSTDREIQRGERKAPQLFTAAGCRMPKKQKKQHLILRWMKMRSGESHCKYRPFAH